MNLKLAALALVYLCIAASAVIVGVELWLYFDAITYRIVTVFIGAIVLSNCLAKLLAVVVYREVS